MAFQLRRGTNAQRLGITPLQGELIYTTDTKALYIGDGTTAGGTSVGSGGGGATDLNDLTDVVITGGTLASGQVLKYDGTNWVNGTDSGGGASALDDLTDVVITGTPTLGQVLKWDGTNWVNGADSGSGASALDDLIDVVITGTPTVGEVLKWDGTNWVNDTDSGGGAGTTYGISAENATGGVFVRLTGSDLTSDDVKLAEGTNITITRTDADTITINSSVAEGDVLDYVGPWLETGTHTGIAFTYDPLTNALSSAVSINSADDVDIPNTPSDGDVLKWDGLLGKWTNATALLQDDPAPALSAGLNLNGQDITGTGDILYTGNFRAQGEVIVGGPDNYTGGLTILSEPTTAAISILDVITSAPSGALPMMNFVRTRGNRTTPAAVAGGDVLGGMRFFGQGTDLLTDPTPAAAVFSVADPSGTVNTDYTPGALVFQVKNNAGTLGSALVINQDGIVKFANNTVLPTVVDEGAGADKYLTVRIQNGLTVETYYIPLFVAL